MHNLQELKIWRKAVALATEVYEATEKFPKEEIYGLTSQCRRAAVSVSSNIAEGAGRDSKKEFKYFLSIANGSSYELITQLTIGKNLAFIKDDQLNKLTESINEIQKMIYTFRKRLSKS